MKCLILGAGKGNRLRPLTNFLPKYLLPFGDKTIVDRGIETLVSLGLDPVFVKRKEQPNPILRVETVEVPESKKGDLIETIFNAKKYVNGKNFCWTGGEVLLTGLDFEKALEEHKRRDSYATFFYVPDLRFTPRGNLQESRVVEFSSDRKERFDYSFIPFVITNKRALEGMEKDGYFFMESALSRGELVLSFEFRGNLWNIDTPREYFEASLDLLREYTDSFSHVEKSKLNRSFIYNSRVSNSDVQDSIIINANLFNQKIKRKIIYGGKDGCSLDIPN